VSWLTCDPRPIYLPPGLALEGREHPTLELRVLWWVARARWMGEETLATLCAVEVQELRACLRRLQARQEIRLVSLAGRRALLTNGGLVQLGKDAGLTEAEAAHLFAWKWERRRAALEGASGIADRWFVAEQRPGRHRLAVLRLVGWLCQDSESQADWGVSLEEVWLEHETARVIGTRVPRPDACLIWRVRKLYFPFFLEVETGSQRPGAVAEKIWSYAVYGATDVGRARWGQAPGVLVVCASAAAETRLAACIAQVNAQLTPAEQAPVLLTEQGWLRQHRLLEPIWRSPGEGAAGERGTLWGRDDADLMQYGRLLREQERLVSRYRHAARTDWLTEEEEEAH